MQDLVLKAFGADEYFTDAPDMAFYGVWDIGKVEWSDRLCELFGVRPAMFGKPTAGRHPGGTVSSAIAEKTGFAVGTPVCVGAGDQNCGVVGMGSIKPGMATVTLGTAGLGHRLAGEAHRGIRRPDDHQPCCRGHVGGRGPDQRRGELISLVPRVIGTLKRTEAAKNGRSAYEYLNDLAVRPSAPAARAPLPAVPGYRGDAALERERPRGLHRDDPLPMAAASWRALSWRASVLEIRDIMQSWFQAGVRVDLIRLGGGATKSALWNQIQADIYRQAGPDLEGR